MKGSGGRVLAKKIRHVLDFDRCLVGVPKSGLLAGNLDSPYDRVLAIYKFYGEALQGMDGNSPSNDVISDFNLSPRDFESYFVLARRYCWFREIWC